MFLVDVTWVYLNWLHESWEGRESQLTALLFFAKLYEREQEQSCLTNNQFLI